METTEKLWREFSGRLRAFILKSIRSETEADDLLQEVFAKIHAGIGQLKDPAALEPWLFQITRNAMVDSLRQRRDVPGSTDSLPARSDEPSGVNFNREIASCLKSFIVCLPEKYRTALLLVEHQGLTQKETARQLGLSLSGAKSRIQRGREQLRKRLTECCEYQFDTYGNVVDYRQKAFDRCACNPPAQ